MTVSRTICLGFLAVIAAGTLLLMMPFSTSDGNGSDLVTALFSSTSAACVTGLSVVDVGKYYSFWCQLFILLLMQVGGLGYMTSTTFLLLLLRRRFSLQDKMAIQQSLDLPGMGGGLDLVRSIIVTTLLFESVGVLLLMLVFVPDYGFNYGLWLAIFHSVSAFTNGSYSLFSNSFIDYARSPILNFTITGLIIFGGLGYQVIVEMLVWLRERLTRKSACTVFGLNFKIVISTTFLLLVFGTLSLLVAECYNPDTLGPLNWQEKLMAAWFHAAAARTSGFNTVDIGKMHQASLFIIITLMFVGGAPGSMAGGIKITTFRVLLSCRDAVLRGTEEVLCYQRKIPTALILRAVAVTVGSGILVAGATAIIALSDLNLFFLQILFEVTSAFGTVGYSTGITPNLSILSKLTLIATMYAGRVGVLLVMSALGGESKPSDISYPESNLLVG